MAEAAKTASHAVSGDSLIIGLAAYSGGELYVDTLGKLDVHNRWQLFDGNVPHLTCPLEGERYRVVFFHKSILWFAASKEC